MEEKLFHTWHHQRTVLIGDACHKMHPIAGLGAVNAMQDAVTLANWLNILPAGPSLQEVESASKRCLTKRPDPCHQDTTLLNCSPVSCYLPKSIIARAAVLGIENRPQVAFLPLVSDRGTIRPLPQRRLFKTKQIMFERAKALVADHKPEISWFINC
ncbi:hypothetical protein BG000_004807 [Podila horticola]|nr:hypothetical protein BG000_004807 [Podila horticola]